MSGIATTFPLHLWCQAIPQVERQLLLLRQSNVNPTISAYAHVYGPHEYNAEPFVPILMETLVQNKPRRRKTFAENFSKVHVLRTSFEHYRSWIMWMKETKTTRISGTVFHKNKYITNPDVTPEDRVISEMYRMSQELKENPPEHLSDTTLEQLMTLGDILKQKNKYECGLPAPHHLPNPPFFSQPPVPPLTPPRVPNGTENPSPPPRVKPNRRLRADAVPENRIGTPPRVGPP